MTDSAPKDPAVAFAEEMAKQLPVKTIYEDIAQPSSQQIGQIGQDLVKTLQLVLAPFQFLAAYQDRLRSFIDASVRRVPEDKRVAPATQILGPVLEAIKYEPAGTPIDQMFSELLSSSMDTEKVADAHPALPLIIRQLSTDEALLLQSIAQSSTYFEITSRFDLYEVTGLAISRIEKCEVPTDGLVFPKNDAMYRDHLVQLGLIRYDVIRPMEPIFVAGLGSPQIGGRNFQIIKFTELGASLMRASGFPPKLIGFRRVDAP